LKHAVVAIAVPAAGSESFRDPFRYRITNEPAARGAVLSSMLRMKTYTKRDFPVADIRQLLEPGPVVLVSSAWKGRHNIMTMGWHTVLEFTPSLIGCVIAESNVSFDMIRRSRQCVINVPTVDLADQVVGIGNCDGDTIDKFEKFHLTPEPAAEVAAPLIKECHANLECRIHDSRLVKKYNFFILEVLKAHIATAPKYPRTLHYRGQGLFITAGPVLNKVRHFTKWKNAPNF
jgi:flavin reductase (DIM6/NTAB) family NADH-FMN oxidoreductase RutF